MPLGAHLDREVRAQVLAENAGQTWEEMRPTERDVHRKEAERQIEEIEQRGELGDEDKLRLAVRCIEEIGVCLPRNESWDGGPGRLEDIAAIIDRLGFERPNTSEYEKH